MTVRADIVISAAEKCSSGTTGWSTLGGAWEVEHSIPWSLGGTDHINNLYPACVGCNRGKGTRSTRTVRAWNGRTGAPLSRARRNAIRNENRWGCAAAGFLIGTRFGPGGALLYGIVGGLIGDSIKVK